MYEYICRLFTQGFELWIMQKGCIFENYLDILNDKDLFLLISVPLITDYSLKSIGGKIYVEIIDYVIFVRVDSCETSCIMYSNALNLFVTEPG